MQRQTNFLVSTRGSKLGQCTGAINIPIVIFKISWLENNRNKNRSSGILYLHLTLDSFEQTGTSLNENFVTRGSLRMENIAMRAILTIENMVWAVSTLEEERHCHSLEQK